ncbi:voltage-gated potassium channel-like protein [Plakobranchus ocellatus]|uniref:Voltage-gated potassium channel-like protein n=1 Tax=Plakobranchus ocellatus TaxID=259542 RepID=A0AAV4DJM9_9GAST|nr:voltage-gated potassium channel-like protein [Plakobranchus ocellatus]
MAFETEDDLISELRNWFDNLDVDFFRVGINSLLSRWQKCIDLHGDYVEKLWKSELQSVMAHLKTQQNVPFQSIKPGAKSLNIDGERSASDTVEMVS